MSLQDLFAPRPVSRLAAQPGDIFFTRGRGLFGAAIRLGTRSRIGHVGIVRHVVEDGTWVTHEARGRGGFSPMWRDPDGPEEIWVWRFDGLSDAICQASDRLVAQGHEYDWGNIFRFGWQVLLQPANAVLRWAGSKQIRVPLRDNSSKLICSDAVAQVLEVAGAVLFAKPTYELSPGDVKELFEMMAAGYPVSVAS